MYVTTQRRLIATPVCFINIYFKTLVSLIPADWFLVSLQYLTNLNDVYSL